jgi:LAGLIDADG DNA endonuclease family protein
MVPVEYLAGFVDGEGYLGLARIPRRNGAHEYCVRLSIYNTNRSVLDEIRTTWGGTMSIVARKLPVWKPSYALIWTNAAAAGLIRKVAPFLVVKSRQAEALIAFDERIQAGRRSRDPKGRLLPLSLAEVGARESVYLRLKQLNRRGAGNHRVKPNQNSAILSKLSATYLAGFIDAEGSLMITKARVTGPRMYQYRARITVSNTKREVLEAIQHTYGGILSDEPARDPAWSPSYQLIWTDGVVGLLLSSVKEQLRVRAPQARILSRFIQYQSRSNRADRGHTFPSPAAQVTDFREVLRGRIKKLNRRGLPR